MNRRTFFATGVALGGVAVVPAWGRAAGPQRDYSILLANSDAACQAMPQARDYMRAITLRVAQLKPTLFGDARLHRTDAIAWRGVESWVRTLRLRARYDSEIVNDRRMEDFKAEVIEMLAQEIAHEEAYFDMRLKESNWRESRREFVYMPHTIAAPMMGLDPDSFQPVINFKVRRAYLSREIVEERLAV